MKQRKLAHVIILGLITLGIYDVYWLISTRKEMIAKGYKIPSLWRAILYPLLVFLAGIAFVVVGSEQNTMTFSILAVVCLLGSLLVAIILGIRFLGGYCRAAEQITNHDLAYGYSFWMGVVLYLFRVGFIWEAIVQYHFNRIGMMPAAVTAAGFPQPAPGPAAAPLTPTAAVPSLYPQPVQTDSAPAVPPAQQPQTVVTPPQDQPPISPAA